MCHTFVSIVSAEIAILCLLPEKNSVFSSNPTDPKFEFSMCFFVINLEDQPSQNPTAR